MVMHEIKLSLCFQIVSLLVGMMFTIVCHAGEYKLVRGQQFELCREFEKNLNTFKDEPPMVCERKINPEFKDFTMPKWKALEPKENMDVLEKIIRYRSKNQTVEVQDKKWKTVKNRINKGKVRLWRGYFDIDHNGKREVVWKLNAYGCDPNDEASFGWPSTFALSIVDENKRIMDKQYQYRVLHPLSFDVFLYKGRTYLINWRGRLGFENGHISVYEPFNVLEQMGIQNRPICRYEYMN